MIYGVTTHNEYDDCSVGSSSDYLAINQVFVPSYGSFRNCGTFFEALNGQVATYQKDENLNSRSAYLYETDGNVRRDFLKSSQKESNAAAGIWKCEKVPSENLIDKRAVFVIKKCPKKGKNDTTELVIRKCIRNKKEASKGLVDGNKCSETSSDKQEENNMQCIWKCIWKDPSSNVFQEGKGRYRDFKVLETLTKKVLPFFKARKCNSCEISKIRVNDLVKCLGFKKED